MSGETPDRFAQIPGVPSSKGVALNPPPGPIAAAATKHIADAFAQLPADKQGGLFAVATRQGDVTNTNLAFAVRGPAGVEVVTWIGKSWGDPVAAAPLSTGAALRWTF